jgi:cobalt-zinc-cadmium efflux system membrane fusion protein
MKFKNEFALSVGIKINYIVILLIALQSCHLRGSDKPMELPAQFCISDSLLKIMEMDTVKSAIVENELRLTGKVTFDEGRVIKIFPLAGGNINAVDVELGDYVQKNQILANIHSSDVSGYDKDLAVALSNVTISEKNLEVAKELYKSGYSTEREYLMALNENEKAKSELTRIKDVLTLFGKSDKANYVIRAPISGFIVEKNVNSDMQIRSDNTNNLFTISDLKTVWVMASVYESDIEKIKAGYTVAVTTLSYPSKVFTGKIDKLFHVLDPLEKVMKVRVRLDNTDYLLKPEMYANVMVSYTDKDISKLFVPSKAVIFDKNKYFVMVCNGKCNIETREVELFKTTGCKTYIEKGLKEGDRIISKSQLYIYDALND